MAPLSLSRLASTLRAPVAAWLVAASLLGALAPLEARADKVKLKSGQVLKGKVQDRGTYVIIEREIEVSAPTPRAVTRGAGPSGPSAAAGAAGASEEALPATPSAAVGARKVVALASIRIERADIESIEIDGQAPRPPADLDVVIFISGDELAGHVEIRNGGKDVVIVGEGDKGEITLDARQVRTILWSKRGAEEQKKGEAGVGTVVQQVLADLVSGSPEAKKTAKDRIQELGVYALPYLESRAGDPDPTIREAIRVVRETARLKTYMTRSLSERVPDLARTLVEGDEKTRLQALKEAVVASPGDTVPILMHLARNDKSGAVRAFVLGQLTLMDRSKELIELLDSQDGGLRFAAALALGDNGLLVGVPLVIEGLKHSEVSIRKIAIQKLESWTAQSKGFFAEDTPEKRAAAVARWEEWWAKEGKAIGLQSIKETIRSGDVTEDDKAKGVGHWMVAQNLWDKVGLAGLQGEERRRDMLKVRFELERSLESWPQNVTARISLATVLYVELADHDEAKKQLELVLRRYEESSGDPARLQAQFHLGRIARLEKSWGEAEKHYQLALTIDPKHVDTLRDLAILQHDRAIAEEGSMSMPDRRRLLLESVKNLGTALDAVDAYQLELNEKIDEAVQGIASARPFEAPKFRMSVDKVKDELRKTAADIRYLRGRSSAALMHRSEAYQDFVVALELEPQNPLYQQVVDIWNPTKEPAPRELASPPPGVPTPTGIPGEDPPLVKDPPPPAAPGEPTRTAAPSGTTGTPSPKR